MPVITAATAKAHQFDGATWKSFVSPSRGSSELVAWRAEIPAGAPTSPHRVNHEEVVYVLRGRLRLEHDGSAEIAEAGDVVVVPADTDVHITNPGDETAETWVTTRVGFAGIMPDGSRFEPPWVK
ncbi:MAG TPA: cupin domain-containing protein [Stackebrandtia sp.]|jgi:quercetin dioxygenase-like cupin family protein|uniref:cupin domain-containing protein n=1 Tax=Stackebrandtia sp. TaxID=2023065 RepID=UPI002D34BE4D|nr:cupin domain-containing protein [Stackebrandtia sp.]HZE40294.1 cupin domain-containing protein [Stackebrandtia sp.]